MKESLTLKIFHESIAIMKRIALGCVLLAVIVLSLLVSRRRHVENPASGVPIATTGSAAGAGIQAGSAAAPEDEESPTNQRTRPQQRPPDVKHQPPPTPVAEALPGKPGFVKSPFNDQIIDVTGIPSGSLAADPTFPAKEKRYFRVP